MEQVKAYPRKRFFVEMITRDISLEDCILDLVDNAIDSLLRTRSIDIEKAVLGNGAKVTGTFQKHSISIAYDARHFAISDDCGGIPKEHAKNDVFCFGPSPGAEPGRLGVYGIGLKRAILKLGKKAEVKSHTQKEAYRVRLDLEKWLKEDESLEDWTFELDDMPSKPKEKPGTAIEVTNLYPEVARKGADKSVDSTLRKTVAQTYAVFLSKYVSIEINGVPIDGDELPIGRSKEVSPGIDRFQKDGVTVVLTASLAQASHRRQDSAGWYVLCNGRVVVRSDKTELTGWGVGLPSFHSKFIGFVGVALLLSEDPLLLPWTTTKRGLNRESTLYQMVVGRMGVVARPVISFLSKQYPTDPIENPPERGVAERVSETADLRSLFRQPSAKFRAITRAAPSSTTKIQYDAPQADLEKIKRQLRRPSMSASAVGRHTFDHYLKTECP